MTDPLILTIDVGTQSLRAMLMNKKGEIEGFIQRKYDKAYFSPEPGWTEQEPEFYFDMLCEATNKLRTDYGALYERVIAVTLTSMRDSILCLDKELKPLRNIIIWLDQRRAKHDEKISFIVKTAVKLIKMDNVIKSQYRQAMVNWIIENQPDIWEKTHKIVFVPTYLNYKLTGKLVDSAANMIGHLPFDYKNRTWQKKGELTRCVCDVPLEKLCELVPSGETIGRITKDAAKLTGIPEGLELIATGSDKACETLGLSVTSKNKAALSFGTTATIQFATREYVEPQQFMPAYPSVLNDMYNPEIQIYRGYWLISWFKNEFAQKECEEAKLLGVTAEQLLDKHLKEVPAGSDGLMVQPFWSPGLLTPEAKGAVIGFSDVHTRVHIYRAIIEGLGFTLMEGMYKMEKRSKHKIDTLFVAGGGSQSSEICQITADMFGLPVKRIQTHEASGLGASMAAFVAKGVYKDFDTASENMVHIRDMFTPRKDEHELYMKLYNMYCCIYPRLEPLYKKMKQIAEM